VSMKCTVDGNVIHMDVSNNSEQWHHFMEELSITTLAKYTVGREGKPLGHFTQKCCMCLYVCGPGIPCTL